MSGPKTVLYVQHYPDGGSVFSLLDLVRSLDPARYRPIVAFRAPSPFVAEFEAVGIPVVVFPEVTPPAARPDAGPAQPVAPPPTRPSRPKPLRREIRRFLRRDAPSITWLVRVARHHRVDLIHANNDVLSNRDALVAAALVRRPLVQHVRGLNEYQPDLGLRIDRLLTRTVDRFLFISEAVAERCRAQLPVPAVRSRVLDNPFDISTYVAERSAETAAELDLPPGAPVVLHLGRLARWKGQDVFLRAMPSVLAEHPDAIALLVGSPLGRRGHAFEKELAELAAELGITEHVRFAGARRDVAQVFAQADVVVHTSTTPEPFGRVVVEAMAAGRPVIGADDGGVTEIIDDTVTGLLVPPGDPGRLAAAISRLLADPAAARAMGARAHAAVTERFGLGTHARAVEGVYDELT